MLRFTLVILFLALIINILSADIIYVPSNQPTIQAGIDAAVNGDSVLIAAGNYTENLIISKNIYISSISFLPDVNIRGDSLNRNINIVNLDSSTINGLIISNGRGIIVRNSKTRITNCIIENCRTQNYEGLLEIQADSDSIISLVYIYDCIFQNNITDYGVITLAYNAHANIIGNIIIQNEIFTRASEKGIIDFAWGYNMGPVSAEIRNNIISNNIGNGIGSGGLNGYPHTTIINNIIVNNSYYGLNNMKFNEDINTYIAYNNIWNNMSGNYRWTIAHNTDISTDPLFISNNDYHLQGTSPCIDAGHPFILDELDGTRSDIGAYGGSKIINDVSPPNTYNLNPVPNQTSVNPIAPIIFQIRDNDTGVDSSSIVLTVENMVVNTIITGDSTNYIVTYTHTDSFNWGQVIDISINAKDLSNPPNIMDTRSYSFTIDLAPNRPPYVPDNPWPPDSTVSHYRQGNLYWGDGEATPDDPDPGDVVTFYVYLEANNPEPQNLYWSGQSSHQRMYYGGLFPDTDYYWKVVAIDQDSAYSIGPVWKFRTESEPVTGSPFNQLSFYSSPGPSPTGLAFDGQYLWSCDKDSNKIYKHLLDNQLSIIGSWDSPVYSSDSYPTDLTWDGNNLWLSILGYGGRVVKLDNSLNVINEGYGYVIGGISWITDTLLIGSFWEGRIYQGFTNNRTEIYDFGWQQNIYGMDWDGQYVWVAIDDELFKCTYDDSSQFEYKDLTPIEKYNFPFIIGDIVWIGDTLFIASTDGGGKIYKFIKNVAHSNNTDIFVYTDTIQGAGTQFWVDVQVGDSLNPVTDLFGVSFSVHYTNTQYIDVVTPYNSNVVPGSFMGSNVVFLQYVDDPNGQVDVGISRQAGQGGVSGYGRVARIQFSADLNTPHNTPVAFTIDNITANDPNGAPIQLDPKDVTITISSIIVWPGDANNDGTANVADVLPLGLYYNSTGPARPNASVNWAGQVCPPGWSPEQAAYADCNGDGIIDVADVLPIGLNYNQTHSKRSSQANWLTFEEEAPTPEIRTTIYDQNMKPTGLNAIANGEPFYIGLAIGKAESYVGTSFTLDWRLGSSDMGGFTIDRSYGQNGLKILGDWQSCLLAMNRVSETEAKCEFGFSLKNHQHSFDGSDVALVRCIRTGNAVVPLTITDLVALDWEGQYHQANPLVGIEEKQEPLVIGKDFNLGNYPNPFNPATTIRFALPQSERVWLTVYNTLGQQVAVLVNGRQLTTGEHEYHFDASSLANGLYFYRLQVGQKVVTRKMLLMK